MECESMEIYQKKRQKNFIQILMKNLNLKKMKERDRNFIKEMILNLTKEKLSDK